NGTTGNVHLVAPELLPDLHDAIAAHVVLPYTLDVLTQQLILLGASASPFRLSGTCCMQVVTGRSDLHHAADRLDPVTVTVLVNEGVQGLLRRRGAGQSGSAWAKYALARRRISFALRSSRFSRSRALMRSRSSVVWPGRWPISVWCLRIQPCRVWGTGPILGA